MAKKTDTHDPNHVLDKAQKSNNLEAAADPGQPTEKKSAGKLAKLQRWIFSSNKTKFASFVILFAVIGGAVFLFASFADSGVTYANQVACIDLYGGNHKFVHNGNCTAYEINPEGLTNQVFTWCASPSNANAWLNDGQCPATPPPPPPTGDKTYSQSACIDPTPSSHQFLHSGGCTQNEHGVGGYVSQNFTWCAAAANANNWKNDGPCPSSPGGFDVTVHVSPAKINPGQKVTVSWTIAGQTDGCAQTMGTDSTQPDPAWNKTVHTSSSAPYTPPSTVGRYTYVLHCTLNGNTVGDASDTVISNPVGITLKSYTDNACINTGNDNQLFVHRGNCTDAEVAQNYITAQPFTWCATTSDATKWQSDGLCPIDPASPEATGPAADQTDENTPGDDNPDQGPQTLANGTKDMIHILYLLPCDYDGQNSAAKYCQNKSRKYHDLNLNRNYNSNGRINTALTAINAWFKPQVSNKIFRLDKKSGKIDVTTVVLPLSYVDIGKDKGETSGSIDKIQTTLTAQGFNQKKYPNKIFLIYYEGVDSGPKANKDCGVTNSSPGNYSVVFLRDLICGDLATGEKEMTSSTNPAKLTHYDTIAAHELIHALGFVDPSCGGLGTSSGSHVGDDPADVMYYPKDSDPNKDKDYGHHWYDILPSNYKLDAGHDTYNFPKGKTPSYVKKDPACNLNDSPYLAIK